MLEAHTPALFILRRAACMTEYSAQRAIAPAIIPKTAPTAFRIFSLGVRLRVAFDADPMPGAVVAVPVKFVRRHEVKLSFCRAHSCFVPPFRASALLINAFQFLF